ncbi:50S ribosomal protein L31 [Candidatus Curtissbacteria bacterium RIFCSPHIGHO2_01_FULL_41_44]|uniref:Large ribosomal subunit protein bL31 n=1 Tax=Candidatus Curtissbacteria bacterium RIFCSPLOWO2_01_FULL_42_50 TaxID=1797730 RepID=A0A1F5H817_9BACT|nr:MAG: 50S ribosomal protein L31 [Candidatus Curtissbacteria bacterium RIFCSPHIGHO2_01_FULL_41_44]OGE00185.1 MAG: 50S ribosomal protein L31 [Candidatus Curtissbacteria bacterium RIFCSPLOWO2_01_FULL_42_50]OGE02112.1 MAG: 50S ribosomal protein L31 [Candidatus Curtissbacteria bacterium RIFCSPLOWO2_12_FULL_41_16]OGE09726.1 MAG: 50S ribosomal protein L31 [Candidatus Curtissbacteria bacterium RIFCSPLOWO2_02_FULL_42_37]
MKANIHPQYFNDSKITCACGNTFTTGSTLREIHVDVCNMCHPFFTGEMKYMDTLGRVEKFQKSREKARLVTTQKIKKEQTKEQRKRPTNLREMLELAKKQASS